MWEKIKGFAKAYPNLTSLITFILFFSAFAYYLGWLLSFIVSVSLAIHEYSHAFVMKRLGMQVKAVIFIPFLGAVALGGGKKHWTRREECLTAIAGPLAGYLSAVPVYFLLKMTGDTLFFKALVIILLLNLFNMLPLSPLDGGRVAKSLLMSFKNKTTGFVLWIAMAAGVLYFLGRIGASIFIVGFVAFWAWQDFSAEWKFWKLRRKIVEWIEKEYGYETPKQEILDSLKKDIAPDRILVYLDSDLGRLLNDVCGNETEVALAAELLGGDLNPPHLAPLSVWQRVSFAFMYLALIFAPVLFYLNLK